MNQLGMLLLQIRFAITRFGWVKSFACLMLIIGIVGWRAWIPHLHRQINRNQQTLQKVTLALQKPEAPPTPVALPPAERHLAKFYASLGENRYVEQQVKTLFAIAGKTGLVLSQGEYKPGYEKNGRYHSYQILLPVKGGYPAIRKFCEQTLLAIPFASLDEMNFKRDTIGNRALEAKLRMTLYLNGKPPGTSETERETEAEAAEAGGKPERKP